MQCLLSELLHRRCQAHCLRKALDQVVDNSAFEQGKLGLKDAWNPPKRALAKVQAPALISQARTIAPTLADWSEGAIDATLAVHALADKETQRRPRSINGVAHDRMAMRHRTAVIRILPNGGSLIRLAAAFAMERHDKRAGPARHGLAGASSYARRASACVVTPPTHRAAIARLSALDPGFRRCCRSI